MAKKAREATQGTTPFSTPTAAMRAGVSCIAANATATCSTTSSVHVWHIDQITAKLLLMTPKGDSSQPPTWMQMKAPDCIKAAMGIGPHCKSPDQLRL